jgi:hypothetical protein
MREPNEPANNSVVISKRINMLDSIGKRGFIFVVNSFVLIVEIRLKLFNKDIVVIDSDDVVREQEPDDLNRVENVKRHSVELMGLGFVVLVVLVKLNY